MFVVVYLLDAKKNIIVPETFIYELNEEKLKNYGANRNQSHLIYWSNAASDGIDGVPNPDFPTDFTLPPTNVHPPREIEETCYIVRLKRFFSKFIHF